MRSYSNAVALRLAEKGRPLLGSGEYEKALVHFEKALALDYTSYQPYIYFYLAGTHDYFGNYRQSSNFLEIAASWLNEQPAWTAEVATLRENTFAQGIAPAMLTQAVEAPDRRRRSPIAASLKAGKSVGRKATNFSRL
jgi:tetratricopeptide (TPR) repeat protein